MFLECLGVQWGTVGCLADGFQILPPDGELTSVDNATEHALVHFIYTM
jgi:hypothetical protein